jgi:predicted metal-dependent hydrolase
MNREKIIYIEGVGDVLFQQSKRAKYLNISVKSYKTIRVAIPFGLSFKKALNIVYKKVDWIQKHQKRIKNIEKEYESLLKNEPPINKNYAKKKLIKRLDELADNYGYSYEKVFIRNQKTRWGSCSSKNNINLNMKLLKLPGDLIDYVILHELVHTKVKNHSKQFWAELNKVAGDAKKLDKELKKYQLILI